MPFVAEHEEGFGPIELRRQVVGVDLEGAVEVVECSEAVADLEMEGADRLEIVGRGGGEDGEGIKEGPEPREQSPP